MASHLLSIDGRRIEYTEERVTALQKVEKSCGERFQKFCTLLFQTIVSLGTGKSQDLLLSPQNS